MAAKPRKPRPAKRPKNAAAFATGGDNYVQRGSTQNFSVAYLASLGALGITVADALLLTCENQYATMRGWFKGLTPDSLPFQVHVTDGKDGASHPSCKSTLISVGANSGPASNLDFMRCLLFAEVAEVLMNKQHLYWDCAASNGEALSRVLAADLCLGARPLPEGALCAPIWLKNREQNWIDHREMTDKDETANGCGVLFLNWLCFAFGHSWQDIIAASEDTLAKTYKKLTGQDDAWAAFRAVIDKMFPPGQPVTLKTDNPFRKGPVMAEQTSPAAAADLQFSPATGEALVQAFRDVLKQLRSEQAAQGEKPYLFPDGINDIEFECKFGGTEGLDFKVTVKGGK
jgi:hypothetical protein